jgi:hypothetical protein
VATYLHKTGATVAPYAAAMGAVETHLAADQGHQVWLDGAIVGVVKAHLAADQGNRVCLDRAGVDAVEAHLAAVATVAKYVSHDGRVTDGDATAEVMAADKAAAADILAAADEVVTASSKVRL